MFTQGESEAFAECQIKDGPNGGTFLRVTRKQFGTRAANCRNIRPSYPKLQWHYSNIQNNKGQSLKN